jgi:putative acyl-CoA dehydrogenase
LLTPAAKYWICKAAPAFAYEAMECLGGNGYVEDSVLPRLYREAPVNAIWEGSGNVMCLDVLRVAGREPDSARAVLDDLADDPALQDASTDVIAALAAPNAESQARRAVQQLAYLAAARALAECASPDTAALFMRTRRQGRAMYGSSNIDDESVANLLNRALPN